MQTVVPASVFAKNFDECLAASLADVGWATAHEGVRIFTPKVLAVPDELSAGEYWALLDPVREAYLKVAAGFDRGAFLPLEMLAQCQLQAAACPELLEYTRKK